MDLAEQTGSAEPIDSTLFAGQDAQSPGQGPAEWAAAGPPAQTAVQGAAATGGPAGDNPFAGQYDGAGGELQE